MIHHQWSNKWVLNEQHWRGKILHCSCLLFFVYDDGDYDGSVFTLWCKMNGTFGHILVTTHYTTWHYYQLCHTSSFWMKHLSFGRRWHHLTLGGCLSMFLVFDLGRHTKREILVWNYARSWKHKFEAATYSFSPFPLFFWYHEYITRTHLNIYKRLWMWWEAFSITNRWLKSVGWRLSLV